MIFSIPWIFVGIFIAVQGLLNYDQRRQWQLQYDQSQLGTKWGPANAPVIIGGRYIGGKVSQIRQQMFGAVIVKKA